MNMSFVANYRLLLDSNPNKKFYIAMTTKPTGSGDYYPGVFKSRKVYELPSSTVVSKGADSLFYAGTDITSFRRDLDHKEMALAISHGPLLSNEVIQFMSINVDSGTTVNQFSGILKECYFSTAGGTNRQVVFDNSIARKAELNLSQLTVGMGTLQVNMGGFTFNGVDELLVTTIEHVNIRSSNIDLTHTTNGSKECLDVHVNNSQTVVEISGSVLTDLSGSSFTDAKLNVYDLSANVALDKLTYVDIDANTNNLKVFDLEANNKLGQFSFFTNDDTATDLRVRVQNIIEVRNPETEHLSVTESAPITSIFAKLQDSSENGISSTASESNGNVLNTRLFAYDVANDVTREVRMGENRGLFIENINSVDFEVVVKQSVPIEISGNPVVEISGNVAVSASASQYGSYANLANNVATILPAGVTSGIDVSDWSYFVGAYQDYYSGTAPTGSLRLQYSFDNSVYYDLFNTTISPSGAGTPRTANIQKQDIPAINWIRFKNDTNQTMTSVTITLLGGSLS
jgi:hypothetical protein